MGGRRCRSLARSPAAIAATHRFHFVSPPPLQTVDPLLAYARAGTSPRILARSLALGFALGLCPIVGVPLPLISYGGTAMLTLMVGSGVLLSVSVHREIRIPRSGLSEF